MTAGSSSSRNGLLDRRLFPDLKISGINLIVFLESKYQRSCSVQNEHFYSKWSKSMDYQNWYICNLLGNGAYAKVYLVKQVMKNPRDGKPLVKHYAMKQIRKSLVSDAKFAASTMKEREILLKLEHPFILKLHYAFQTPEDLYMIFDYLEGGDLFFHINKKGHLGEKEARYYGAQMILGLQYLHSNQILYRDLKPENVLLDSKGNIKLADFGISKKLDSTGMDRKQMQTTFSVIGTL